MFIDQNAENTHPASLKNTVILQFMSSVTEIQHEKLTKYATNTNVPILTESMPMITNVRSFVKNSGSKAVNIFLALK